MNLKESQLASCAMSIPQAFLSLILLFYFDNLSRKFLIILPTIISQFSAILIIIGISYTTKGLF